MKGAFLCPLIVLVGMLVIPAGNAPMGETPQPEQPMLRAVVIHLPTCKGIARLRQMPIEIVRVMPDPEHKPDAQSPCGGWIVEAVVTVPILKKLKRQGFWVQDGK